MIASLFVGLVRSALEAIGGLLRIIVGVPSLGSATKHTYHADSPPMCHGLCFAIVSCLIITHVYVGLLYIWQGLPRDHPSTIKRRMLSVLGACILSWLPLSWSLPGPTQAPPLMYVLGLTTNGLIQAVFYPLVLTAVLFSCPLYFQLREEGPEIIEAVALWARGLLQAVASRDLGIFWSRLSAPLGDGHLVLWRNLVVAPLNEEFVFRACMAPLLLLKGCSTMGTVFLTPVFFAAAHIHHIFELVRHHRVPLAAAAVKVSFQCFHTLLFGWYATFLYLRTGSLAAPVAVHAFCNWMGFPDFAGMSAKLGSPAILAALTGASIAAFAGFMGPMTQPVLYPSGPLVARYTSLE